MRIAAALFFAGLLFPLKYDLYPHLIAAFAAGGVVRRPVNKI